MACHAVQESFKYSTKSLATDPAVALALARAVVDADRPALDHDPRETATTPRVKPRRRVPASKRADATTRRRFEGALDDDDANAPRRTVVVVVVARAATRASVVAMRGIVHARDMMTDERTDVAHAREDDERGGGKPLRRRNVGMLQTVRREILSNGRSKNKKESGRDGRGFVSLFETRDVGDGIADEDHVAVFEFRRRRHHDHVDVDGIVLLLDVVAAGDVGARRRRCRCG